jgi:hypothetical protein
MADGNGGSQIKIDKGVPPPANDGSWSKYAAFEVGDSAFFAGERPPAAYFSYAKRTGRKFTIRKVTENGVTGYRIWRVS